MLNVGREHVRLFSYIFNSSLVTMGSYIMSLKMRKEASKQDATLDVCKELLILLDMKEQTGFSKAKLDLHLK